MDVYKYLIPRRRISGLKEILFKGFSKKEKERKRLSFINQHKIEFLPGFTGCRKVLEQMPAYGSFSGTCSTVFLIKRKH